MSINFFEKTPQEINNGGCYDLAMEVAEYFFTRAEIDRIFNHSETVKQFTIKSNYDYGFDFGHIFIQYKDKFYDAEAPNGVDSVAKLPVFRDDSALRQ